MSGNVLHDKNLLWLWNFGERKYDFWRLKIFKINWLTIIKNNEFYYKKKISMKSINSHLIIMSLSK